MNKRHVTTQCDCGNYYPKARQSIGYFCCLSCGDKAASIESERKSKCLAPAFNKGPIMYIGSNQAAKDIGK